MTATKEERLRLALAVAWPDFTYRQREMLKMYLLGQYSFDEIGNVLHLKPSTVKRYLRALMSHVERLALGGAA
jgi:DNA-binding CsgD family transcriptional regulator